MPADTLHVCIDGDVPVLVVPEDLDAIMLQDAKAALKQYIQYVWSEWLFFLN